MVSQPFCASPSWEIVIVWNQPSVLTIQKFETMIQTATKKLEKHNKIKYDKIKLWMAKWLASCYLFVMDKHCIQLPMDFASYHFLSTQKIISTSIFVFQHKAVSSLRFIHSNIIFFNSTCWSLFTNFFFFFCYR